MARKKATCYLDIAKDIYKVFMALYKDEHPEDYTRMDKALTHLHHNIYNRVDEHGAFDITSRATDGFTEYMWICSLVDKGYGLDIMHEVYYMVPPRPEGGYKYKPFREFPFVELDDDFYMPQGSIDIGYNLMLFEREVIICGEHILAGHKPMIDVMIYNDRVRRGIYPGEVTRRMNALEYDPPLW